MDKIITRTQKRFFNNFKKFSEVLKFLKESFDVIPQLSPPNKFRQFVVSDIDYSGRNILYDELRPIEIQDEFAVYDPEENHGTFFGSKVNTAESDWSNIFIENG